VGRVGVDHQERVYVTVDRLDPVEMGLGDLDRRHLAVGDLRGRFCGGEADQL
jgi:hypothetical protein